MTVAVGTGARGRSALPAEATSFIDRRREMDEARVALGEARVVTVTGPAGVGKTRLALRVAKRVERGFGERVCWVELAEVREAAGVAPAVMTQLGLRERATQAAVDVLVEYLRTRQMLLILDNCEHLVDACAELVDALLRQCPQVRMLATSRQPLNVVGERVLPIAPLPVPGQDGELTPEALALYDSVALFLDRASAVRPTFAASADNCADLARLCRSLDGIPLAIELAARRVSALSPGEIDQRLRAHRYRLLSSGTRGAPERQRSLQALIDWSYDLCTAEERLVWRRAAVFSGGFDLTAAEFVCRGDGLHPDDVVNVIASLVDKSVLCARIDTVARYQLLEDCRVYGQDRLTSAERARARRRHRDWYMRMVERFDAERWQDEITWVARIRDEHANLRAALDYCATEPGEAAVGLRMAILLDDYWGIGGWHTEVRRWLAALLAATDEPSRGRASALRLAGWYALLQGDIHTAPTLLAEAAVLAHRLDDRAEIAYVGLVRGLAALFTADLNDAESLLTEALAGFRATGDRRGEIFALFTLGIALALRGEQQGALSTLRACVDLATRVSPNYWRSYALWALAYVQWLHDDVQRAEQTDKEALRLQRKLDNKLAMAFSIDTLAWIMQRRGDPERAATLFGAAEAVWHRIGAAPENYRPFGATHDDQVARTRADLGAARFDTAFAEGYRLPAETALDYALEISPPRRATHPVAAQQTPLTRRERDVAELVAQGMSNHDIAARLVLSQRTVETHVQHILVKLGFHSRAQIAAWLAADHPTTHPKH